MFHVVSGRPGPGHADIVMPGTFLDEAEERALPDLASDPSWRRTDRLLGRRRPVRPFC